jgi:hypothetical protein
MVHRLRVADRCTHQATRAVLLEMQDIGPPRPPPEQEEDEAEVGPPRPPPTADDDEPAVGPPRPPVSKKRKVRAHWPLARVNCGPDGAPSITACLIREDPSTAAPQHAHLLPNPSPIEKICGAVALAW